MRPALLAPAALLCLATPAAAQSHLARSAPLSGVAPPLRAQSSDWPSSRGDPQNTGFRRLVTRQSNPSAPLKNIQAWQFQAGSHVWGYQPGMTVWSSAAVGLVQGQPVVFVGSYDHNLYALDARNGRQRWRFTTGGGVYSAPVLWHGRVFVAASDRMLYALDADDGSRQWIHTVQTWRPTMGGARLSSPCVGQTRGQPRLARSASHPSGAPPLRARDALFFGHWVWDKSMSGNLQAGGATAVDIATGKKIWTTALGDNQVSSPVFTRIQGQGRLFIASENGNLYALDADDGHVLWTHTERDAIKGSPTLFQLGGATRVVFGSKFGRVRCLDAWSGKPIWTFTTGHWVDASPAVARFGPRPVIIVGSYDMQLYALDGHTGSPLWSYRTAGGVYSSAALAPTGDHLKVLALSWDHHLHCVAGEDGSLLWSAFVGRPIWDSISLGDSIWSSPVVAEIDGQQVAYVGSYAGPFHAIPLAEAAEKALARPSSNLDFWVTLPLVILAVTAMTLGLTRRYRRRRRANGS